MGKRGMAWLNEVKAMAKFYIDEQYRCHTAPGEGLREFEDDFFDNKSPSIVEFFLFVPEGESCTREDGETFEGKMITLAVDDPSIWKLQEQYEAMLAEVAAAYQEGVNSV